MTSPSKKRQIVRSARRRLARNGIDPTGRQACLHAAAAVCLAAQQKGVRLVVQAGTAYWPCVTPETDDGVSANVFGFAWGESTAGVAMITGRGGIAMPEMHVWAGDIETQEIVDLTTGTWPEMAEAAGFPWKAPAPPTYLWDKHAVVPSPGYYEVNRDATLWAYNALARLGEL